MQSSANTVAEYLEELPAERRAAIAKVRAVIRKNLPKGYAEQMQYGMIGYVVPHKLYPAGYHATPKEPLPFIHLASQKNFMALYMPYERMGIGEWFKERYAASGKKLEIGKACIRFKKLEDLPLDVVGEAIGKVTVSDYVARYEAGLLARKG